MGGVGEGEAFLGESFFKKVPFLANIECCPKFLEYALVVKGSILLKALNTGSKNLSGQYDFNDISLKLNRSNALLFKMRKYVSLKLLRSIEFAIFDSYSPCCLFVQAQNCSGI